MNEKEPKNDRKKISWLKLALCAFGGFVVLSALAFFLFVWPILSHYLFVPAWRAQMNQAAKAWSEDRGKGEAMMKNALQMAKDAHVEKAELMAVHRKYADLLYDSDDWKTGDEQIAEAIAVCPEPQPKSAEADQLTHAYQDRGWNSFNRHLKDPSAPTGQADQEQSVQVAEKAFGPDHEQTIYKIPSLALIYAESGQSEKAHALMKRAIDAVDNKPSAKECAWFVYDCDARMKVMEHKCNEGVRSFIYALSLTAKEQDHRNRIWNDFTSEVERNGPAIPAEEKEGYKLLGKEKFERIDQISDALLKSKEENPSGFWKLDYFGLHLAHDEDLDESGFQQRILELKTMLKQRPKSAIARVALADVYVSYAWLARGNGYSDTVTDEGWKKMGDRLAIARELLDSDTSLKQRMPRAFRIYSQLAIGQGWPKDENKKLLDECHKMWPDYHSVDLSNTMYLLPRWHGEPGELEQFIQARADAVGGARGDMLYAQLVWYSYKYMDDLFKDGTPIKWSRVKAGFKQIFAKYPKDAEARTTYLRFCSMARDKESMLTAFDGFDSPPKP